MDTTDTFAELVMSRLQPGEFKPFAYLDVEDDSLEVWLAQENCTHSIMPGNPAVQLYRSRDTGKIVGVRIIRISREQANAAP